MLTTIVLNLKYYHPLAIRLSLSQNKPGDLQKVKKPHVPEAVRRGFNEISMLNISCLHLHFHFHTARRLVRYDIIANRAMILIYLYLNSNLPTTST